MFRVLALAAVLLFSSLSSYAQTAIGRTVTLTYKDGKNPAGVTYNIHRVAGLCSGTPAFVKIATAVPGLTYDDKNVAPGNYCYVVTATLNNMESAFSNAAAAAVLPFAVTLDTITVAEFYVQVPPHEADDVVMSTDWLELAATY